MGPDLQAALDALPEAFREAVWCADVEEFPYAEIARNAGYPWRARSCPGSPGDVVCCMTMASQES